MRNLFATAWDIHWDHVDEMIVGAPGVDEYESLRYTGEAAVDREWGSTARPVELCRR